MRDWRKGETVGIDATTLEANAALRTILRRDTGESYQAFLTKLAQASGFETPTRGASVALNRKRKKKGSNDVGPIRTIPMQRSRRSRVGGRERARELVRQPLVVSRSFVTMRGSCAWFTAGASQQPDVHLLENGTKPFAGVVVVVR
ncbi:MAG: hypothetical protein M3Q38_07435 [Chloroflexota bacterium]|nr:hypothetical protein [Chloroflexota bacterium]